MSRHALIVGINRYDHLCRLRLPSADADAIAHLLGEHGGFRITRLPERISADRTGVLVDPDARVTEAAVQEALALTGMAEVCAQLPQGLATPYCPALFSQGQHQLLGIARAIALNPRLLLLDEITANLDALTERQIIRALQAASKDRAVLSISHRLYEASGGKIITLS